MLGLAIDSADRIATAALWRSRGDDGDEPGLACSLLAQATLPPEAGKADQLIAVVERLLGQQKLAYADLDVIAVNRGPGSFTGIRSAVALGRGLALAIGRPVLGVTSHEALATTPCDTGDERPLLVALDARRGEIYVQAFSAAGRPLSEIEARAPRAVADNLLAGCWRVAGSGAGLAIDTLDDDAEVEMIEARPIDAAAVAEAAALRLAAGERPLQGFALRPLYVRAPDAVPPAPLIRSTTSPAEAPV